jgi:hypothetical protein
MRRIAKTDRNHAEIVKAFRQCGMSVKDASAVGKGFPDLVIGFRGLNFLVEVKDGDLTPGNRRLTADQETFHAAWAGQICVALSVEDAIAKVVAAAKELGRA